MAKRSQHTFSKRQREQKKAEKAARKRTRRAERTEEPSAPLPATTDDGAPDGDDDADAPE